MKYTRYHPYTKPDIPFNDYKDDVIVAFHGFLSAMPNAFFKQLNNDFGDKFTVVGYNYDYFDVEQNLNQFDLFYKNALKGKKLYFAGTSLGGFWAHNLSLQYPVAKTVIINPTLSPHSVLSSLKDQDNYSDRRKKAVLITSEKLSAYKKLRFKKDYPGRQLVLLTCDDDIQDYSIARDFFKDADSTDLVVFDQGGHSINFSEHRKAWTSVQEFLS